MNIVVLGAGYRNKGNEAMLRVVQREIGRRIEGANIMALLPLEEESALAYASGVIPVSRENQKVHRYLGNRSARFASVIEYLVRRGTAQDIRQSFFSFQKVADRILPRMIDDIAGGLDAVLDIHGYAFGGPWPLRSMRIASNWGDFCRKKGVPYFFFPQSWGPFDQTSYADGAVAMLRYASYFYAREELSRTELARALKKPAEEIPTAPDIVLKFGGGSTSMGEQILAINGVGTDRPVIGIAPNMRVYDRTKGAGSANEYVRFLIHLCDYLIEKKQAAVVLIPNEINPIGYIRQDDRFLCSLILSMVRNQSKCFALREYYSAEQIRSVVSCLRLLIGSRFHTLVFALSAGVPLIGLGWAHKYDGLLRQFGLQEYFCHYSQVAESTLSDLVDRAWDARDSIAYTIQTTLPHLHSQIDSVFDNFTRLCRNP
jgi:polysaccharide pyruvyl transferase WcaK-like protein